MRLTALLVIRSSVWFGDVTLILSNPLRPIFSKPRRLEAIPLRIQIDHGCRGWARIKNIRVIRVIRGQKIPRHYNTPFITRNL